MRMEHQLAIMAALAALCLGPAARAQCPFHYDCESWVEYDSSENEVWAYSYTDRTDDWGDGSVGVEATFSTPADGYYDEDLDEQDPNDAEVDFGPGNDGDGSYYIYGTHYADNDIFYSSGSTSEYHDMPSGETSSFQDWGGDGTGLWQQTLTTGSSFAGTSVQEYSPTQGRDACWFPLSRYAAWEYVDGSSWTVQAFNIYGLDSIGYFNEAIQYYRDQLAAPCGATIYQQMQIWWNGEWQDYGSTNTDGGFIGLNMVTSTRQGQPASH